MKALAYYNYGRWVVDCPHPGCTDAREVNPARLEDTCILGHPFTIEAPPAEVAEAIAAELKTRPFEADQGWYPKGHVRAELAGQPTGQSIADLRKEAREVAALRAKQSQERRDRFAAMLAEHGIKVRADGYFEGRI
jgi:hypothetical protein